jgi:hypothetical protein
MEITERVAAKFLETQFKNGSGIDATIIALEEFIVNMLRDDKD